MQGTSHLSCGRVFAPHESMKLMKIVALDLLALGIGLLVSGRLSARQRRSVGATLLGVGATTTIPAVLSVLRGISRFRSWRAELPVERDRRLIGTTRYPRKGDDPLD
jgi:hypothetical protein